VTLRGRSIGVFNVAGEFFALRNACPHQGGPLCLGVLSGLALPGPPGEYRYVRRGEILRCPWHGWEFDVRTGQSYVDPATTRVRAYPVELVPGPHVAETYEVTLEGDLVVVDV
jgi:nitrite reductase/ring-hydroxylating ferredoxin subunit